MTGSTGSENKFSELFRVVTRYSQGDHDHQEKALRVIAGVYDVPLEVERMPDAKQVVDDILASTTTCSPFSTAAEVWTRTPSTRW
jgi:hypothetical protein